MAVLHSRNTKYTQLCKQSAGSSDNVQTQISLLHHPVPICSAFQAALHVRSISSSRGRVSMQRIYSIPYSPYTDLPGRWKVRSSGLCALASRLVFLSIAGDDSPMTPPPVLLLRNITPPRMAPPWSHVELQLTAVWGKPPRETRVRCHVRRRFSRVAVALICCSLSRVGEHGLGPKHADGELEVNRLSNG